MRKSIKFLAVLLFSASYVNAQTPVLDNPKIEIIATGFNFIEGPVWVNGLGLLFSDIPENHVNLFSMDSTVSMYFEPSGKSNGLTLDKNGKLLLAQHLNRQVVRREDNGTFTVLASRYNGKRLNSPNDLVVKSDGSIFFTDPPFGLNDEPDAIAELPYAGIYRISPQGNVYLLDSTLAYPNGIAFSKDESKLYVTDSEIADVIVWDVINDSTLTNKTLFYDIPGQWGDGMKTDRNDFLYVTGPNGVWIFNPNGSLFKNVTVPGQTSASNCGWNEDSTMLYVTSNNSLYRIRNDITVYTGEIKSTDCFLYLANFPNPFSDQTEVVFEITRPENIDISVYNIAGQNLCTLTQQEYTTGKYNLNWDTSELGCGQYFIVLKTGEKRIIKNCVKSTM